jgi:hypothetical protein
MRRETFFAYKELIQNFSLIFYEKASYFISFFVSISFYNPDSFGADGAGTT